MGAHAREEAGDRHEADDLRDFVAAHERAVELDHLSYPPALPLD